MWTSKLKVEGSMSKNVVTSTKYALLQNAQQFIVSKDIIKVVHDLCIEKQCSFLGMKQCLQLLVEKEHKELEHWQAKLMLDDWWAIHAQVRILFEKVRDDFDVPQLSMQGFLKTCVCTYNVFVKFVDGKMQLHQAFKVSNLLHQFHFEERSFVQVESKLISTKLNRQACEENIISCESAYTKQLQD